MSKPLFALADEYLELAKVLSDEQDMPNEIIDEILDAYSGELDTKCWNVAAMVLQFEGEAEMVRTVEKRIVARRKNLEGRADWLRNYLLVNMIRTGINELASPEFVVKVCDNPPKVILDDEDAIPDDYKEEETVVTIRKDVLRRAMLDDGEIIPGCHLEKGKRLKIS
jgi:hypothetical protein